MKSLSLGSPHAIVMVGIAGSGKTFFAEKFANTFGAPYVNADQLAQHAKDIAATTELTRALVGELVKTKQTIVVDAGGNTRRERSEFAKFLRAQGYAPLFVWVQIDQETARYRSNRRTASSTSIAGHFSPPHASEKAVVVSGKHTYATQAKVVLKHLSAPRSEISAHRRPLAREGRSVPIQ